MSGAGERGRGGPSASEEAMGSLAQGLPQPRDLLRLCCVGCPLGGPWLGRERDFSPGRSGAAAPVGLTQGLPGAVRAVPGQPGRARRVLPSGRWGWRPAWQPEWVMARSALGSAVPASRNGEVRCKPGSFYVISFKEAFV